MTIDDSRQFRFRMIFYMSNFSRPIMKKIKIAHISDLHLTKNNRMARSEPKVYGKLRGMNKYFKSILLSEDFHDIDWLFVTGDVTDRGDLDSWHYFQEVIDKAGFKDRCLVVPGNHDTCNLGLSAFPPHETKQEARDRLKRLRRGLSIGNQEIIFPWAKSLTKDIVIFGLDSANHGNLSVITNAVGRLGFRQLEALARLLRKYKEVPVKIILLHHSPNIPRQDTEIKRGFAPTSKLARWGNEIPKTDRQALRLLAVTHNVRLILHGHLHRAEARHVNGVRIIGAPATTQLVDNRQSHVQTYDIYLKSKKIFAKTKRVMLNL